MAGCGRSVTVKSLPLRVMISLPAFRALTKFARSRIYPALNSAAAASSM
jgi:hypothetical protein